MDARPSSLGELSRSSTGDARAAGSLARLRRSLGGEQALVGLLGLALLVRVLTDDWAAPNSHRSGSLDLSGAIALGLILAAGALLHRRRRGVIPTLLALLFLATWTLIAFASRGLGAETAREGVREASVVAVAVLAYNALGALGPARAARIVQLVGALPAAIALRQLVTHSGVVIAEQTRSNGTFFHPDGAAMYFAIAAAASLWLFLDGGRHRWDAALAAVFTAATISTFSLSGLIALMAMVALLGALRRGGARERISCLALAPLIAAAFMLTPLGATRVDNESATNVAASQRGDTDTSLAWRLYRWRTLIPAWEEDPLVGHGLGTTVTAEATAASPVSGQVPHNEYIRYLVETGLIGLAVLLCGLAALVRRLLALRAGERGNAAALALTILAGCLVNAMTDNTFLYTTTGYAAALIVFAALAGQAGRQRSPRAPA